MNKIKDIIFKQRILFLVIMVVLIIFVSFFIGNTSASTKIDQEKLKYDEINQKIKEKEEELDKIKTDIEITQSNYDYLFEEYEEALSIIDQKDTALQEKDAALEEIEKAQNEVDKLKKQEDDLKQSLKDKESELNSLTGKIQEAKGQPKVLSAGKFTVGKDIAAGRYKVTPNGQSPGNFFVNDGMDVNIILGSGDFGESEYVFEAFEGDEIELTISAKFTPIE